MRCPNCGFSNREGALYCEDCGYLLFDEDEIPTKKLDESKRRRNGSGANIETIVLHFRDCDEPLMLEPTARIVIGRIDPRSRDDQPDLDLTPFGASEKGVSRAHVVFDSSQNPPLLSDLGSSNGTFVNGQKLTPNQICPIHDGDEIRLGRLVARIYLR